MVAGMSDEESRRIWAEEERMIEAAHLLPPEEQMDARSPDLWWSWGDTTDQRTCYWCIGGRWYWRKIDSGGVIVARGEGEP
jgi:hypothetical protein